MRTIDHWIGGAAPPAPQPGAPARLRPGHRAAGRPRSRSPSRRRRRRGRAGRPGRLRRPGGTASIVKRARVMFAFRELRGAPPRRARPADRLRRARQGACSDAAGEVQRGLEVVEFACGIPQLLKGEYSEQVSTDVDAFSLPPAARRGAGITPFNFPVMVPMWMHPIAIACGNTFVLKPSERDPSASILVAELYAEAGLPDGVFNVVHGDKVAVDAHPRPPRTSRRCRSSARRRSPATSTSAGPSHGKRVQALGGAKNHAVVLPDADLDFAADAPGRGRATARPASAAWRSPPRSPSARPATRWSKVLRARPSEPARRPRPGPDERDGPGGHRGARDADRRPDRAPARRRAPSWSWTAAALRVAGPRGRLLRRPDAVRPGRHRDGRSTREEIFGPVLVGAPGGQRRRGDRAGQRQPVRQRHGHLHLQRGGRPQVPARGPRRDDRHQRARSRCRWPSTRFGGWKDSLFGDTARPRPRGRRASTPGARSSPAAGPHVEHAARRAPCTSRPR